MGAAFTSRIARIKDVTAALRLPRTTRTHADNTTGHEQPDPRPPTTFAAAPKAHGNPAFLDRKLARIDEPHIRPLNDLVRDIRSETGGEVPWFDPDSGGVDARALFLYEAPGARSTGPAGPRRKAEGGGIISPDNNDDTAKNSWLVYRDANLHREHTLVWNIVPWYLGTTSAIRSAKSEDVAAAQPYLHRLLDLLTELRLVVAFGDNARDGWLRYLLREDAPLLPTLACPHPSPRNLRSRPDYRDLILAALQRTAEVVRD
jgi:hypothetical protein